MSHLGRPNGQFNEKFSLKPVHQNLSHKLKTKIHFSNDCVGEEPLQKVNELSNGEVLLLENLRFHPEEEGKVKDPQTGKKKSVEKNLVDKFREQLSRYGEIYVNDAFGTSHRAHSSMVGTNHSIKASGLLLEKEIKVIFLLYLLYFSI